MSESSKRGKRLETEVAKLLRSKFGGSIHRDKRSGAGGTTKTDIKDWYELTPFDIECKDHETIKIKEWMRQAISGASFRRIATLVFRADENVLACVKFEDLVNMAVELRDLRDEVAELKKPVEATPSFSSLQKVVADKKSSGAQLCRKSQIVDAHQRTPASALAVAAAARDSTSRTNCSAAGCMRRRTGAG